MLGKKENINSTSNPQTIVDSNSAKVGGLSYANWLYLYIFAVATVATIVLSHTVVQYKNLDFDGFQNGFPGDLENWARRGSWDNIIFSEDQIEVRRIDENSAYAYRSFSLKPSTQRDQGFLRVSGSVKTLNKKTEDDSNRSGALMIWLQNDADEVVKYLNIGKLDGNQDEYELTRIVKLSEGITQFSLVLTNQKSTAEFALTDATVNLLVENSLFSKLRTSIFIVWIGIFAASIYFIYKKSSTAMFAFISAITIAIMIGVVMPESMKIATIRPIYSLLQNMSGLSNELIFEQSFKIGHFIFFFVISLTLLLYRKSLELPMWKIILLLSLFAVATEGLQLYLIDRTTRLSDLAIDLSAIVIASMITILLATAKSNRQ